MLRLPVSTSSAALTLVLLAGSASAQCFDWEAGFHSPGATGAVEAQVVFDDGTGPALYLGGALVAVGATATGPVARWDGVAFTAIGSGLTGTTHALATYDAGAGPELYAGGSLQLDGVPVNIVRWDGSGWTALDGGVNGAVWSLTVHDHGAGPVLIAGGAFWRANNFPTNTTMNHVGQWDGLAWSPLWTGVGSFQHPSPTVYALASYDGGGGPALYAGGSFANVGLNAHHGIARWDGSSWAMVGPGLASASTVRAMVAYDDGSGAGVRLAVAGQLKRAGDASFWPLLLWDGSTWEVPSGQVAGHNALSLCTHDDGSGEALYLGGPLGFPGTTVPSIARWDGSAFTLVASTMGGSAQTLGSFDDGTGARLIAGGHFDVVEGQTAAHLAAWRNGAWSSLTTGDGWIGQPRAFALFDDGGGGGADLYAGGETTIGSSAGRVRRWDGTTWLAVGEDLPGSVHALASFDDGSGRALYASGRSTSGSTTLSRWDGTVWQTLPSLPFLVTCFAVHDDPLGSGPALYAGMLNPDPFNEASTLLARWNGSGWSGIPSPGFTIASLCSFDDGQGPALFAGGFLSAGAVVRWDGTTWTSLGASGGGGVSALIAFDDGSGPALYAAGNFTSLGGVPAQRVARWDGSQWNALGAGLNARVSALGVYDDGSGAQLVAGGAFTASQATPLAGIARWNGSTWSALGSGVTGTSYSGSPSEVLALAAFDDGIGSGRDLYAGGNFLAAGGHPSSFFAKWQGCGAAGASICAGDGSLAQACPCANTGAAGRGCENSAGTGGARLTAAGTTAPDGVVLTSAGELPTVLSIFLQGTADNGTGVTFGDGVRCVAGNLKRLYTRNASGGVVSAPSGGDPSITAQSAALGDPIAPGSTRYYQVYYRDPELSFCAVPLGDGFNVSSGVRIVW